MKRISISTSFFRSCCLSGTLFLIYLPSYGNESGVREDIALNSDWKSIANDTNQNACDGFEKFEFDDETWITVDVPHNWDAYHGYLRKVHGNRHGYAWYRKKVAIPEEDRNKRFFLWFEGVGSYATVWLNGKVAGYHAGGRTSFTIDVTDAIAFDTLNILAVRADHPANIRDLPWVCGGCSEEWGFSEGSQPMGIFRPVHLIVTNDIRIEPFGVHLWNDSTVSTQFATIFQTSEIKNYSSTHRKIQLVNTLYDQEKKQLAQTSSYHDMAEKEILKITQSPLELDNPVLWSPDNPYLYTLETEILEDGKVVDRVSTPYGIRSISWPVNRNDTSGTFLINGKPFFINGIGEYEHQLGRSHAFSDEQIRTRAMQIKTAGFNAFRDAHQPHNLKYQQYWDTLGILWWTQMSAHIWFDNPRFRENFKILLREWVKERRNNPSNIMWGLQNESTLPADFAEECVQIIREMDPTTSTQRLVTTCNGGTGTDWNVIQNWSGTYGGDPYTYDEELTSQLLNGEYGAWRSIDLHTEGTFNQNGIRSENRMTQLMEMKVQQAESVRDKVCGQFLWLLSSHDNPGRFQNGEGYREIDRLGPVNYKGLLTSWGEPVDAFYMYRANYIPADKEPMVYIVSHTWPNRWRTPGIKDSIVVYSNCEDVELFNDHGSCSLGKMKSSGTDRAFIWRKQNIQNNILHAVGYREGEKITEDLIVLPFLPEGPGFYKLHSREQSENRPTENYNYLYRVNCGGNGYTDEFGSLWMTDCQLSSDTTWGSLSWTDEFGTVPFSYASQRRTWDPIKGTNDWPLFQSFRYGREKLSYHFPVPDGIYRIELFFVEPWYGPDISMDCRGWRKFSVAVNNEIVIPDLDIWYEKGHDWVLKKIIETEVKGGKLKIHFPDVPSGQAVISAIAIASKDHSISSSHASQGNINNLKTDANTKDQVTAEAWLDIGDEQFHGSNIRFFELPPQFFGAEWIKSSGVDHEETGSIHFRLEKNSDVFLAISGSANCDDIQPEGFTKTDLVLRNSAVRNSEYTVYSRRYAANSVVELHFEKNYEADSFLYSVIVVPVSTLNASADQRPSTDYDVEKALVEGEEIAIDSSGTRKYFKISDTGKGTILWQIQVGLASTYELSIRYKNPEDKAISGVLEIIDNNDRIMQKESIDLDPSGERWRTFRIFTSTDINAGSYIIRLFFEGAEGLQIENLSVR